MRYVCWITLFSAIINFGCAKQTDGFAPGASQSPVLSPEIPSDDGSANADSLMSYSELTEESGWVISFNHGNVIQNQSLGNGWEVLVVQD